MSIVKEKQFISEKYAKKLKSDELLKKAINNHNSNFKKEDTKDIINKFYKKYSFFKDFFVRDFKGFKHKGYNLENIELQLIEHLFCKFKTSKALYYQFLSKLCFVDGKNATKDEKDTISKFLFFIDIANGTSIYKTYTKNFLTKNETHFLFNTNEYFTLEENLMFMLLKDLKINKSLKEKIIKSKFIRYISYIYKNYNKIELKISVEALKILFNLAEKNKDDFTFELLEELYDFLIHNNDIFSTLKGRSLNTLIQLNNEWHIEQIKNKTDSKLIWEKNYNDFDFIEDEIVKAQFFELTSSKQLLNEGKSQHHCVGSYASSCKSGYSSIFATMIHYEKGPTIEINNRNRTIVQIKRRFNAKPTSLDMKYINRFMLFNNLKLTSTY